MQSIPAWRKRLICVRRNREYPCVNTLLPKKGHVDRVRERRDTSGIHLNKKRKNHESPFMKPHNPYPKNAMVKSANNAREPEVYTSHNHHDTPC
jgi:hypothetical protein